MPQAPKPLDIAIPITPFEDSIAFSVEPHVIEPDPETDYQPEIGLLKILRWIRNGKNPRAKEIRVQSVFLFLEPSTSQVQLANEIGCTKAAISKAANLFRDHFKIKSPCGGAAGMRSNKARDKMSRAQLRINHDYQGT